MSDDDIAETIRFLERVSRSIKFVDWGPDVLVARNVIRYLIKKLKGERYVMLPDDRF